MQVTEPSNMHYGLFLQLSSALRKIKNKVLVGLFTLQIHHISSFLACKTLQTNKSFNDSKCDLHQPTPKLGRM